MRVFNDSLGSVCFNWIFTLLVPTEPAFLLGLALGLNKPGTEDSTSTISRTQSGIRRKRTWKL